MCEPEVRLFYGALVFILVFATLDVVNDHDCTRAAECMMLTAHTLGIGSGWIELL